MGGGCEGCWGSGCYFWGRCGGLDGRGFELI